MAAEDPSHIGRGSVLESQDGFFLVAQLGTDVLAVLVSDAGDPMSSVVVGTGSDPSAARIGETSFLVGFNGDGGKALLRRVDLGDPFEVTSLPEPPGMAEMGAVFRLGGGGGLVTLIRPSTKLGALVGWFDANGAIVGDWLDAPDGRVSAAAAVPINDKEVALFSLVTNPGGGQDLQMQIVDSATRAFHDPSFIDSGGYSAWQVAALPEGGAAVAAQLVDGTSQRIEIVQVTAAGLLGDLRFIDEVVATGYPPFVGAGFGGLVVGASPKRGRVALWPFALPLASTPSPIAFPEPGAAVLYASDADKGSRAFVVNTNSPPSIRFRTTQFCP